MTEKYLTGNQMFEMLKEECERILGKVKGKGKKRQNGVLFFINRNRIVGEVIGVDGLLAPSSLLAANNKCSLWSHNNPLK